MKHADVLAVLAANGVGGQQLAEIEAHLYKRRAGTTTECLGCRTKAMRGDFACGRCSAIKAASEKRFVGFVVDREQGGEGREIAKRPDPTKIRPVNPATPTALPVRIWNAVIDVKEKMVIADDYFTRRIVRLVAATSAEEARSVARHLTGFYPVAVEAIA